jgi:hypothetical protein
VTKAFGAIPSYRRVPGWISIISSSGSIYQPTGGKSRLFL